MGSNNPKLKAAWTAVKMYALAIGGGITWVGVGVGIAWGFKALMVPLYAWIGIGNPVALATLAAAGVFLVYLWFTSMWAAEIQRSRIEAERIRRQAALFDASLRNIRRNTTMVFEAHEV